MNRRSFLSGLSGSLSSAALLRSSAFAVARPTLRILDAHVHLFDPTRAGGVPWPEPGDLIDRPALPPRLRALASPLGVVGAIAVEASPLDSDNDWLLETVRRNSFMVGFIGDLIPGAPGFRARLDQLRKSPLFLGIRYGNLWHRDLSTDRTRPQFVDDLHELARAGLTFESANPDRALLSALVAVAQQVPDLRIVIDHLPHAEVPVEPGAQRAFLSDLEELSRSRNVFIKLSEILAPHPAEVQTSSAPYRARLDRLWDLFGPDRALFGSDWPNSDHVATYPETLSVLRDYVERRTPSAAGEVFFTTSQRAYGWRPRTAAQATR